MTATSSPLGAAPSVVTVVSVATLAQVASVMGAAIFPVIAPRLATELGVSASLIGYQVSITYGAAVLATAFMSALITRYGACRMTQVSLALCALAMLLALSMTITGIVLASVAAGVGMSVMTPASAHLLFRYSPPRNRNLIFSIKQTGVPGGWLILALVAPGITLAFGWRWAVALVFAIAVATLCGLQRVRESWDDDRSAHAASRQALFAGFGILWRRPALRWMAIASFCYSFVQLSLGSYLVVMMVEEAGYSLVQAGLLLSLVQASGVTGRVFWGWLADRHGNGLAILCYLNVAMIACCLLTMLITPQWPPLALAVLFIAFGASAVGWNGIFLAEVARHSPPGMVGAATGGAMIWNYGGIFAGPAAFATLYRWTGDFGATFGWMTLVAAAGLVLMTAACRAAR